MLQTCSKCGTRFYGAGCSECDYPSRPADPNQRKRDRTWGLIYLAIGVGVDIAVLARPPQELPLWPALTAGILFILGGLALFKEVKGRPARAVGAVICAGMASLGFFAAFGSGNVEGGIPFIPAAWNQGLGRIVFGAGACVTAVFALGLFYLAAKPTKNER